MSGVDDSACACKRGDRSRLKAQLAKKDGWQSWTLYRCALCGQLWGCHLEPSGSTFVPDSARWEPLTRGAHLTQPWRDMVAELDAAGAG
jgi:hypothetical protein